LPGQGAFLVGIGRDRPMMSRQRAAAVIIRGGQLLIARERGTGPAGRHEGQEYWTLPGGGIPSTSARR
jgi:8-oxo-dGTP pyrophosphatase MutT (NUDIX family)